MKKSIFLVFALVCLVLCMPALADGEGVRVSATATLETPYHQITALYIEYPQEIVAPAADDYAVVDFQTFNFLEVYERRPMQEGVITAMYTNDAPALREDKTSVPGRYVVLELAPVDGSYYDEEAGMWRPNNIAGIATVRVDGESSDHFRTDWSLFVVTQRHDVLNAQGEVVAPKGVLPAMAADAVSTPEAARFTQEALRSANGLYDINYNVSLPVNYDPSKKYAVVFCQPGGGGLIDYNKQDADGNFINLGANVTRDMVPIAFTRLDEELIVVAVQPWKNTPAEWAVNNGADYVALVDHVLATYAVDTDRVYGIANSAGTGNTSAALILRPDLLTAYAQCNGSFTYYDAQGAAKRFTLYKDELMVSYVDCTQEQIMQISLDPESRLDQAVIDETGKTFDGVIEKRVPIYFFDGTNTESGSSLNTTSAYLYLKERYEALGLTEAEIGELIRLDLVDNDEFHDRGVCEYHESSKVAVTPGYDVVSWLLSR